MLEQINPVDNMIFTQEYGQLYFRGEIENEDSLSPAEIGSELGNDTSSMTGKVLLLWEGILKYCEHPNFHCTFCQA